MRVVVFSGPTLSPAEVQRHLDATCLPPVSQGDVYRASLDSPWAIGIIDGYFERVPAVWHKEILWALSRGIHVFGAASMGSLRAAELHAFGMVGVGAIFEAYHHGRLTDDDEVAILHGPSDAGFKPLSEPLVNIRATLAVAITARVIAEPTREALLGIAKRLFYGERSYARLLERAHEQAIPTAEVEALRGWLPAGRVDQKARDAVSMLERIHEQRDREPHPFQPRFHFEHTDMWEQVGRAGGGQNGSAREADATAPLLDELRLLGAERFRDVLERAFGRAVALDESRRQGMRPTADEIASETVRFRLERGLRSEEKTRAWLAEQRLTDQGFLRLFEDEARLERVRVLFAPEATVQAGEVLRLEGEYGRLLDRAREKQALLATHGLERPGLDDAGLSSERELLAWYFDGRLGLPIPDDLGSYAVSVGCPDRQTLMRVLLRELCYQRLCAPPASVR